MQSSPVPEDRDFQRVQAQFSGHIRDPDGCPPPPGIEDRRMRIYRRLFFNNVDSFLQQAFPVLHLITPEASWNTLVRRFFAEHRCTRPQFFQLAEEFLEFLENDKAPESPAFMLELAHYEWIELTLSIDSTPLPDAIDPTADLLESPVVFTPWMRLLSYVWPVHQIRPDFQPTVAPEEPSCLLVYRDQDEGVSFLQLNMLTARLVEILQCSSRSGREVLLQLADEARLERGQVMSFGSDIIKQFSERGLILGGGIPDARDTQTSTSRDDSKRDKAG